MNAGLVERYLEAANRGLDWVLSLQDERGAFRGAEHEVSCYRKAPRTLTVAGRVTEARRVVDYLRRTHASPGGDFNLRFENASARYDHTYNNAWLALGLHGLAAHDLAGATIKHLLQIQHPSTGGLPMCLEADPNHQIISWGTTSLAVAAFVTAGRLEAAIAAGGAMVAILEAQPEPRQAFFLCTHWSGSLITHCAAEVAPLRVIRFGGDDNHYWSLGSGMAALVMLHKATGDERWLAAAQRTFDLVEHGRPAILHATSSPKIAWGTTLLWSVTRNDTVLEAAVEVAEDFLQRQTPQGAWLGGAAGSFDCVEAQPVPMTVDLAFDRPLWLYGLARCMR